MTDSLKSISSSKVIYPSAIFGLEKLGSLPFERFAYNALRRGIVALNSKGMGDRIVVEFKIQSSLSIDIYIKKEFDSQTLQNEYIITTNVFTPPILLVVCKHFGNIFSDVEYLKQLIESKAEFKREVVDFGLKVIKSYDRNDSNGFANWIQLILKEFDISITNISDELELYDLCSKFIVNHEVAHAYMGQLNSKYKVNQVEQRSLEYLADIQAIDWFYNVWIVSTPDTVEYRKLREFKDHRESIYNNVIFGLESLMLILVFFGISNAINGRGEISMQGGKTHPNSYMRHIIHYTHFMTLVESNYKDLLGDLISDIITYYNLMINIILATGFVNKNDIDEITSSSSYNDFVQIPKVIKRYQIEELEKYLVLPDLIKSSFIDNIKK